MSCLRIAILGLYRIRFRIIIDQRSEQASCFCYLWEFIKEQIGDLPWHFDPDSM